MRTILVTGFGPFPGAPHNPTQALVHYLTRLKRPNLRVAGHVFETRYAAVDRDLPALLKQHRPDALLMFGLHGRARTLRIETLARNRLGGMRDTSGAIPKARAIVAGERHLKMRTAAHRLVRAARSARVRAVSSRDAGSYLCNYLCWRGTEAKGPRLAAFVHVPPVPRKALRKGRRALTPAGLRRAGTAMLDALAHCLGSGGIVPR